MKKIILAACLLLLGCTQDKAAVAEPVRPTQPPTDLEPPVLEAKKLRCKGTVMVGWAKPEDMTDQDKDAYNTAKHRCGEIYKNSPCLKKFELRDSGAYWATCGAPE